MKKDINKIALHSKLFKGQGDWYFCFLKSEKLAHVLALLADRTVAPMADLEELAQMARAIPRAVAYVVSGEIREEVLLADLFSILSAIRVCGTRGVIGKENTLILIQEYEHIVEKVAESKHYPGLLVSSDHLSVPALSEGQPPSLLPQLLEFSEPLGIKDIYKGHNKGKVQGLPGQSKGQESRSAAILDIVRKNNGVSIKYIASLVRDCSEKTIQRELTLLIERGLAVREGERRWSIYKATPTP